MLKYAFSMFVMKLYGFCLSIALAPSLHRESTDSLIKTVLNLASFQACCALGNEAEPCHNLLVQGIILLRKHITTTTSYEAQVYINLVYIYIMCPSCSLVLRPLPDSVSQVWLQDKIWEWPENEANHS